MLDAGWYPSPDESGLRRWWDGTQWTNQTWPGAQNVLTGGAVTWQALPSGMQFWVGVGEPHEVTFTYDKFWGKAKLLVDGQVFVSEAPQFSVSLTREWNAEVGVNERHEVRIVKTRKLMFAGFRPQLIQAFVDGQLVGQYDA